MKIKKYQIEESAYTKPYELGVVNKMELVNTKIVSADSYYHACIKYKNKRHGTQGVNLVNWYENLYEAYMTKDVKGGVNQYYAILKVKLLKEVA